VYQVHRGYSEAISEMATVQYFFLNPFYWVQSAYTWLYAALAASFSRLKEFRSDRFAADAVGRKLYTDALVSAHLEGAFFEEVGLPALAGSTRTRARFDNIYHHVGVLRRSYERQNPGVLRKILGAIMTERPHVLASHPSLGERLRKLNVATALVMPPGLPRLLSSERRRGAARPGCDKAAVRPL
jgi:Zn-dependent protease with chaperone function